VGSRGKKKSVELAEGPAEKGEALAGNRVGSVEKDEADLAEMDEVLVDNPAE
jgi:hypothetical protein